MDSQRLRCKNNMSASVLVTAEKEEDGNECTPSLYLMKNTSTFASTPWTSALKFTCTPVSDSELPETVNLCCSAEMFSPVKPSVEIIIDENAGPCECGKNFIEEICIWEAINNWEPSDFPLLCAGCYYDDSNPITHACLTYVGTYSSDREEILNYHTWNIMLNPTHFTSTTLSFIINSSLTSLMSCLVSFAKHIQKSLQ